MMLCTPKKLQDASREWSRYKDTNKVQNPRKQKDDYDGICRSPVGVL